MEIFSFQIETIFILVSVVLGLVLSTSLLKKKVEVSGLKETLEFIIPMYVFVLIIYVVFKINY